MKSIHVNLVGFFGPRKPLFASRKPRIAQATDLVQGKIERKYEYEFENFNLQ